MGSMEGKTDKIRQILEDAGCDAEEIEAFIDCHRSCSADEQMRMLCRYRKDLLCRTHEAQRQLECMDHFIYQMENGGPGVCETVCGTSCDGRESRKKSRQQEETRLANLHLNSQSLTMTYCLEKCGAAKANYHCATAAS